MKYQYSKGVVYTWHRQVKFWAILDAMIFLGGLTLMALEAGNIIGGLK